MTDTGKSNQDFTVSSGGDVVRVINQARTSLKARDYEAAKAGFRSIYEFLNRRGLGEGLEAMECMADLGATYMALKDYDAALTEYSRLATIMERNLGEANAELRQHLRRYAQACDVAGRLNEAKQLYSRANDLERRYGAAPSRTSAGSLPGRLQSNSRESSPAAGGGSTFAEAIQDAVARSMAKLDNRGKPFEPAEPPKQNPAGPTPFLALPLPPSPFQNLALGQASDVSNAGLTPSQDQTGSKGQAEQTSPSSALPRGFTGSPALPGQDLGGKPGISVPKELSDSQFIYRPKGDQGQAAGQSSAPGPEPAKEQPAECAKGGRSEPAGSHPPAGVGESGSFWRGPDFCQTPTLVSDTASGDMEIIPRFRGPDQEGDYEPVSGELPPDHQSVEVSLDKVFGQSTMPGAGPPETGASARSPGSHADQGGPGYMTGEGNSPIRRKTNPNLGSSKLRQMQNAESPSDEPTPEDYSETNAASTFAPAAPLSYDPYDPSAPYDEYVPDNYPGHQSQTSQPSDEAGFNAARRPGARRASAEWQVEPPEDLPYSYEGPAEPYHGADMHPNSDSSKAMAQWGVPISEQGEEDYQSSRQEEFDRRQAQQPVNEESQPGEPKPFDRRQKPKSMKNLRSRFGQMEPTSNVDDAEFEEAEVMNPHGEATEAAAPDFAPGGQPGQNMQSPAIDMQPPAGAQLQADRRGEDWREPPSGGPKLPPKSRQRRLADNSSTNMTPPEMPPSDRLILPPQPPEGKGSGPRGLLERTGDHTNELQEQVQSGSERDFSGQAPDDEDIPSESRPSSMISRLVSKRHHDTSIQNAPPGLTSEEAQVLPRIRSMVDTARANSADGKYADAARLLQKVVNELAEGGLKDSRYVADCMLLLSEAYEASDQLGPAITSFHQHALMVEKRVGVKDYESIGNWYRLAVLLDKANERDDARTMFEHALGLAEQHLETDDELTANIKLSYDEFLTRPSRPAKKAAQAENLSTQEVLAQNKELRTSALQQQQMPVNKRAVIWSVVSVIVLIAGLVWFFIFMGSMNTEIGRVDPTVVGGAIPAQSYANTDGDGLLRFTGTNTCEVTVDGQLRQIRYIVMKNDLSDLATMFMNISAKQTFWLRKVQNGMMLDEKTMFFNTDAPQLAMASEMRRIGQRVEDYFQKNRSYPRFRQDWAEDPGFGFLNPITRRGEPSIFHVFPRSATPAALFGGFNTPDEIAEFLEKGNSWVGEPELKACSISCAVKHSAEKSNGKPVVSEFYMHATDQDNHFLPASKPNTVSVVLLVQGRNIGNFDLHPTDPSKLALAPMPDAVALVNMSDSPLFSAEILRSVIPVTFIGLAAIIFFGLLIAIATLKSKKAPKKSSADEGIFKKGAR